MALPRRAHLTRVEASKMLSADVVMDPSALAQIAAVRHPGIGCLFCSAMHQLGYVIHDSLAGTAVLERMLIPAQVFCREATYPLPARQRQQLLRKVARHDRSALVADEVTDEWSGGSPESGAGRRTRRSFWPKLDSLSNLQTSKTALCRLFTILTTASPRCYWLCW